MSDKNKKKKSKKKYKVLKTVFQTIPYELVYTNGVIETDPGVFTKAYPLGDVNFNMADEATQQSIYQKFGMLLNAVPVEASFQILIHNYAADTKSYLDTVGLKPETDGLNAVRLKMNRTIFEKMSESSFNIAQEKILIVSIEDDNVAHAMQTFESLDKTIIKCLRRIDQTTDVLPMSTPQRLHSLYRVLNKDGEMPFENAVDEETGEKYFDLDYLYSSGGTSKEAVAPSSIKFQNGYYTIGNTFGKTLFLERLPSGTLTTEFLEELTDIQSEMVVSLHFVPIETRKASRLVTEYLRSINGRIGAEQKKAAQQGYSAEVLSDAMYRAQLQARELMSEIVENDQHIFQMTATVNVFGSSLRHIDDISKRVSAIGSQFSAPFRSIVGLEEYGFVSGLPLCVNRLKLSRMVTTSTASIFLPYTSVDIHQKGGLFYGINTQSENAIVINRKMAKNGNALRLGQPGSGKSMGAKLEMLAAVLKDPKNHVYVIDPMGEYTPLVMAAGGETVELSGNSGACLNPLDMDLAFSQDPVADKANYLIGMMEIIYGRGQIISPRSRSIIDRCTRNIYRGYLDHLERFRKSDERITCDRDAMPTLRHLLDELRAQPEMEAGELADVLELYATGSLSTFASRSNVDTSARFVSYNIRSLGSAVKELALYVTLNDINNRAAENRKRGEWTYIYIDEFHTLLNSESAARHVADIWKTGRHRNTILTGITQNINHVTSTSSGLDIFENCDYLFVNSIPTSEAVTMGDILDLSEEQLEAFTNADPGCGLIYTSKTAIPFDNAISRESEIYKLCSTSIAKDEMFK